MAARPNLHKRLNRRLATVVGHALSRVTTLVSHANETSAPDPSAKLAYEWLEQIDLQRDPAEIRRELSRGRSRFHSLEPSYLNRWWQSRNPRLQLAAALLFANEGRPSHEGTNPDSGKLRNVLGTALETDPDARYRTLAAIGLVMSYYHDTRRDAPYLSPDMKRLGHALARRESQHAVCLALACVDGLLYDWSPFKAPKVLLANLRKLARDPSAPPVDRVLALGACVRMGGISEYVQPLVTDILKSPDIPPYALRLLSGPLSETQVLDLLRTNEIPIEQRERFLNACAGHQLTWQARWLILYECAKSPEVAALAIRYYSTSVDQAVWRDLWAISYRKDLPFEVQSALYRAFWVFAPRADNAIREYCAAFKTLQHLARDPAVAVAAFENGAIPPFTGIVTDEHIRQALHQLKSADAELTVAYRAILARFVPLTPTFLPIEDRRLVIDAQLAYAATVETTVRDQIWTEVIEYAHTDPEVARVLLFDESVPGHHRVRLLKATASPMDVLRFGRTASTKRERTATAIALAKQFPSSLREEIFEAAYDNSAVWEDILSLPDSVEHNLPALVAMTVDAFRSPITRCVAAQLIVTAIPHASKGEAQSALATLSETLPDLDRDVSLMAVDGVVFLLRQERDSDATLHLLLGALANQKIASVTRSQLLQRVDESFIARFPEAIWEAATSVADRESRLALLDRFVQGYRLGEVAGMQETLANLRAPATSDSQWLKSWQEVSDLGPVCTADIMQLIRFAQGAEHSPVVRGAALVRISRLDLDSVSWRRLWEYVSRAEGARVWEDSDLKQVVTNQLLSTITDLGLAIIVQTGPRHQLWPALASLARLPDQALARQAMDSFVAPVSDSKEAHALSLLSDVPNEAVLAAYRLSPEAVLRSEVRDLLNRAFASCRGARSVQAELTASLIRAAVRPPRIRSRISAVLTQSTVDVEGPDLARNISRLLRYAQLEAQLVVRDSAENRTSYNREPDLTEEGMSALLTFSPPRTVTDTANRLREGVIARLVKSLPGLRTEQLEKVLQETAAPAILAAHYRRVHPRGFLLLAEATRVASEGERAWKEWRFKRPEARAQLPNLSEEQLDAWSHDQTITVGSETVTEDARQAAARIRERFRQAVQTNEVPELYRDLIRSVVEGSRSPVLQIQDYLALKALLGRWLGGEAIPVPEKLRASLPEALQSQLDRLWADRPEGEIAQRIKSPERRQELLVVQRSLDRAVDLLRLLHCDERALTRNELRATGEVMVGGVSRGESALAYLDKLRYAFGHPTTRHQRRSAETEYAQLTAALDDAKSALQQVKTFTTSKPLVATECSDFRSLIEIGHRPYAQGSCQNYASGTLLNRALLAYVVDAMTKAIVIRTAPTPDNPQGTPLARAIVRLGVTQKEKLPVVVLEKTYAAGQETWFYDALLRRAAREFAARRGWQAAIPDTPDEASNPRTQETTTVELPASQNGVQYEDGVPAIVPPTRAAMVEKAYEMRVRYLDEETAVQ